MTRRLAFAAVAFFTLFVVAFGAPVVQAAIYAATVTVSCLPLACTA